MHQNKKRSERRKHCALAVVRRSQKFSLAAADPFPGAQDGQNLISFTYRPSLVKIDARNFELSWYNRPTKNTHTQSPTHPQTHPQTIKQAYRQDRLQYTATQLARISKNIGRTKAKVTRRVTQFKNKCIFSARRTYILKKHLHYLLRYGLYI